VRLDRKLGKDNDLVSQKRWTGVLIARSIGTVVA
jgi:hypothetical protein